MDEETTASNGVTKRDLIWIWAAAILFGADVCFMFLANILDYHTSSPALAFLMMAGLIPGYILMFKVRKLRRQQASSGTLIAGPRRTPRQVLLRVLLPSVIAVGLLVVADVVNHRLTTPKAVNYAAATVVLTVFLWYTVRRRLAQAERLRNESGA